MSWLLRRSSIQCASSGATCSEADLANETAAASSHGDESVPTRSLTAVQRRPRMGPKKGWWAQISCVRSMLTDGYPALASPGNRARSRPIEHAGPSPRLTMPGNAWPWFKVCHRSRLLRRTCSTCSTSRRPRRPDARPAQRARSSRSAASTPMVLRWARRVADGSHGAPQALRAGGGPTAERSAPVPHLAGHRTALLAQHGAGPASRRTII
jgi:hypothetical protein